jgi:hypothetical protein
MSADKFFPQRLNSKPTMNAKSRVAQQYPTLRPGNSNMMTAYWLIGREIVLEIQGGNEQSGNQGGTDMVRRCQPGTERRFLRFCLRGRREF